MSSSKVGALAKKWEVVWGYIVERKERKFGGAVMHEVGLIAENWSCDLASFVALCGPFVDICGSAEEARGGARQRRKAEGECCLRVKVRISGVAQAKIRGCRGAACDSGVVRLVRLVWKSGEERRRYLWLTWPGPFVTGPSHSKWRLRTLSVSKPRRVRVRRRVRTCLPAFAGPL